MSTDTTMSGAELRAIRNRLGLTQGELGETLDLHRDHIGRMERGESPITRVMALAVEYLRATLAPANWAEAVVVMVRTDIHIGMSDADDAARTAATSFIHDIIAPDDQDNSYFEWLWNGEWDGSETPDSIRAEIEDQEGWPE